MSTPSASQPADVRPEEPTPSTPGLWPDAEGDAPGGPGDAPRWNTASKCGVGTAIGGPGRAWFTLARGIVSEVFWPGVDRPSIRGLSLVVTDGRSWTAFEPDDTDHECHAADDGAIPAYQLVNTCRRGRFRLLKRVIAHPHHSAVLMDVRLEPLGEVSLADLRLYAVLEPHLADRGGDNTGWLGSFRDVPMPMARRGPAALALACSAPWSCGSAGFVGGPGGPIDLEKAHRLVARYARAGAGNVTLTAGVDLSSCRGHFLLALGFGSDPYVAGHRAWAAILEGYDAAERVYLSGWRGWQAGLLPLESVDPAARGLYRTSAAVLKTHQDGAMPGGIVASLSTPWGETQSDEGAGQGGYHLVWPRDLAMTAGGLLAAGATTEARAALDYLHTTQDGDGHWPQNMWASGRAFWDGVQLGETASFVLLLDLLRERGAITEDELAAYWPAVLKAVGYLLRQGPATQQDRWENESGFTPFTLATIIAALVAAADLADGQSEPEISRFLLETADSWHATIDGWLYVTDTELARRIGVPGYYARILPPEVVEPPSPARDRVVFDAALPARRGVPESDVVSPDILALVRFGLRRPDDPRILDTLRVVDAINRVETPRGPSWRRYNGDRYGEDACGRAFEFGVDSAVEGNGRAWPLLTGERAHYELAAGRRDEAARLLCTMEAFAGPGGMLPEQVWDTTDLPDRGLFIGRPTGSAMPLAWAHAEAIKLRRSLLDGVIFDLPGRTATRYLAGNRPRSRLAIWRPEGLVRQIAPGETLRVVTCDPVRVRVQEPAGTRNNQPMETQPTGLGVHFVDLPTDEIPAGTSFMLLVEPLGITHEVKVGEID